MLPIGGVYNTYVVNLLHVTIVLICLVGTFRSMDQEFVSKGDPKSGDTGAESGTIEKFRRLVDFDASAWNVLIRLKIEMEDRQNKIRVSISDVVNTVLKASKSDKCDPQIIEKVKAELLKLWDNPSENLNEFQRGFEAGLIYVLQNMR